MSVNDTILNKKKSETRNYLIIGDEMSWKVAFQENLWGFKNKGVSFGLWNKTNVGDNIAFYVTFPIQKIIGFGKITEKFIDTKIIWPDEKLVNRAIFSHRLKFKIITIVHDWDHGVPPPKNLMLNTGRKIVDSKTFKILIKQAEKNWKKKFLKYIF